MADGASPQAPVVARSVPRPTARVAVAFGLVAVVTVAARLEGAAVAALVAAVAAAWCVDAVAVSRAAVDVEVVAPRTVVRGEAVALRVAVHAAGGKVVRLRQPAPPEVVVEPAEVAGGVLEARCTARFRGSFALPGAVARVAGPLRLASIDVRSVDDAALSALPDLPRARRLSMRRRGLSGAEGTSVRRVGIGTEFESIRDYDPNDDVRFVNWMATSRAGRPMTNRYRVDENRDLLVLLDTGRLMCAPVGDATKLDVALDATCVVGVAAEDAGDRVGVTAFAGDVRREVEPRRRGTAAVVAACFDLQPVEVDSDVLGAFQRVAGRKRATVLVLTDLVDPAASRTIVEALPVLRRRHEVLVASARDDELVALAMRAPRGYADVTRSAAAMRLLDEQREVVRRVATLGAEVVVAPPDRLGTACVTAYARLKALARA